MRSEDLFENPAAFIERTLALFLTASDLINERQQDQALYLLIRTLYLTLVEAFRKDLHIWECFTTNEQTPTVHKHLLLLDNFELTTQLAKIIEDFCREGSSPEQAPDFYWTLLENTIPQALECTASPSACFGLACRLLYLRRSDETQLRGFAQSMICHLWSYSHNECPRLPFPDTAMVGLLKLLQGALIMLRSLKKPLAQRYLPVDLFERLLFPCNNDDEAKGYSSYQPLVSNEAREVVFDMVKMTCESSDIYRQITAATQRVMLPLSTGDVLHYPGAEDWLRTPTQCSGLTNLGMTCYMNSLLQQLFANLQLRNFLLNIPVAHQGQQPMLTHVQYLFASMQGTSKPYIETVALAKALEVQVDSQDDVHGFFATFFSRLEDNMPDRDTKQELSRFFTGKFITQIKGACGHVSTQTEPFIDVSITVKNKASLQESLNEFVQGEPMKGANQYRCMTCSSEGDKGRLVNAMKRTCLDDVPDNLTFCLKRFTFEAMMGLEGKANDRFEFPAEIDMAVYQRSHLEQGNLPIVPDMFVLVGVIVHQGSLEFGHYWSYIRIGGLMDPTKWYLVEDRNVKPILGGIREVQDECFGGTIYPNSNERAESAYVLLYQRASRFNERHQVVQRTPGDERHAPSLPPCVPISSELNEMISATNDWQYRVAHLFDPQFASFMTWLMGSFAMQSDPTVEGSDNQEERQQSDAIQYSASMDSLATAAASYLLHVVMCDPATSERLTSFSLPLTKALNASLELTKLFLAALTSDRIAFHQIWQNENRQTRQLMGGLILSWLESLRSRDEIGARTVVREIIAAHSALLQRHMDFLYPHWPEYVEFVGRLVNLGPFETALVHKSGYIEWAMDILTLDYQPLDLRARRRLILKAIATEAVDMKILFRLLCNILNEHVDMSETTAIAAGSSPKDDHTTRVRLHPAHLDLFLAEMRTKSKPFMVLLMTACRHCGLTRDWREYPAGQFLARLVDDREDFTRFGQLEMSLLVRFDEETDALEQLLYIVMNLCLVRDDHDMTTIMKAVARTALSWEDVETEMLAFWYESIKLAPVATLEAMLLWTTEYLTRKAKVRRRTATFLREVLFEQPPLNMHECDTLRIRVTRVLVSKLINQLTLAYNREIPRRHCEEMMQVLEHAGVYLTTLHTEVDRVKEVGTDQHKAECLPGALNVEYEESRSTLMEIKRLLHELSEWTTDPASDISPITLRASKRPAAALVVPEQDYEQRGFEEDLEEDGSFASDNSVDPSLDHAG
nr:ubiquitin carboxyl-terminal hydrolase 34 [Quercus suber]